MNNTKIKAVMDEVATEAAERDELIQCIAVALLAICLTASLKKTHHTA